MSINAMEAIEATPEAKFAFATLTKAVKPPIPPLSVIGLHEFIPRSCLDGSRSFRHAS